MTDKSKNEPDLVAIAKQAMKNNFGEEGYRLTIAAMMVMEANDARIGRSELLAILQQTLPEERGNEKSTRGRKKWEISLDAYSPKYVKQGLIGKEKRVWSLTSAGQSFLDDLKKNGPGGAMADAAPPSGVAVADDSELNQEQLGDDIANYINTVLAGKRNDGKNISTVPAGKRNDGKKLEKLAAALLRGIGYKHVEERGGPGDGGVDVIACREVMGENIPHLKVQAKHITTGDKIPPKEIQVLESTVREGEVGVFITTSSFTPLAKEHAQRSHKHLLLIDLDRLVELWVEYYPHMSEEDKKLLPLKYALDTEKVKAASESDSD